MTLHSSQWSLIVTWMGLAVAVTLSQDRISNDFASTMLDLSSGDGCGYRAFGAAGLNVCEGMSIESMMPIGLRWLTCELDAAGVTKFPCRASKWTLAETELLQCTAKLSSHEFLRLMHFVMIAFDICCKVVRDQKTASIRFYVTQLVSTARESVKIQNEIQDIVDNLVQSSEDVAAFQDYVRELLNSMQADTHDALRTSKGAAKSIQDATSATAEFSSEVQRLGESMIKSAKKAADAALAMNVELEEAMVELNNSQFRFRKVLWMKYLLLCAVVLHLASFFALVRLGMIPRFFRVLTMQVCGVFAATDDIWCPHIHNVLNKDDWRVVPLTSALVFIFCSVLPLLYISISLSGRRPSRRSAFRFLVYSQEDLNGGAVNRKSEDSTTSCRRIPRSDCMSSNCEYMQS
jgi:hypothetical protein